MRLDSSLRQDVNTPSDLSAGATAEEAGIAKTVQELVAHVATRRPKHGV